MTDSSQLAMLLARQLLLAIRNSTAGSPVSSKTSVKLLLDKPIRLVYLSESKVRRALAHMDFGADDNGPISIEDLDVKSYGVKTPFGGVATHTTAVVMLIDSEHHSLPLKVTLSSEFAGFEVQVGQ